MMSTIAPPPQINHTRAQFPFWLEQGQQDPTACKTVKHVWVELMLGDVLERATNPFEKMVICKRCYAPRCGHYSEENPCVLALHHTIDHEFLKGGSEPVGGFVQNTEPVESDPED